MAFDCSFSEKFSLLASGFSTDVVEFSFNSRKDYDSTTSHKYQYF